MICAVPLNKAGGVLRDCWAGPRVPENKGSFSMSDDFAVEIEVVKFWKWWFGGKGVQMET